MKRQTTPDTSVDAPVTWKPGPRDLQGQPAKPPIPRADAIAIAQRAIGKYQRRRDSVANGAGDDIDRLMDSADAYQMAVDLSVFFYEIIKRIE